MHTLARKVLGLELNPQPACCIEIIFVKLITFFFTLFGQVSGNKVKIPYTNFASLVQSLLNVPLQKEKFFQVSLAA